MAHITMTFSESWSWEPATFTDLEENGSLNENPEFLCFVSEMQIEFSEFSDISLEEAMLLFQAI